ncbi:RES domain-containing protein [Rhizobium leguminosarum bv. trifolii WSM2297]|uniref:RES domain-containing protein n=1 Tax=Rhizobium leguminosarum bv. trifolii WSM2297 TaxID=754762 RepID=J0KRI8_RHILT|nr:RES family NAD+ phosphorylase [Rhizobium leguminosarum]EJC80179.1 RES domain-containing protein [Rhizobium leguminosarum bv. trifolii WSM2297]
MHDDHEGKLLCTDCVGEPFLSAEIARDGLVLTCDYCGEEGPTFNIGAISDRVDGAFQRHFSRSRMEMNGYEWAMSKDSESSFDFEPEGEQIVYAIMNTAEIPECAAADIQSVLEDRYKDFEAAQIGETTEYDSDLYYHEIEADDREWQETWFSFERLLKTEARFFSAHALRVLTSVFEGVHLMKTRRNSPLVVNGGPGTPYEFLFRARAFQSSRKLEAALLRPDKELGPPPSPFAASGRMNARGISVFYGATDPETAVAEVRPPVGSEVVIGKFQVVRPLRLLDLTALGGVGSAGSYFDPDYANVLSRRMFLRSLSRRMARPVMPDDQEFEYLPTQAIADFLATDTVTPLDGIIFPSVQVADGKPNVVLFHKASLVETILIPDGAETDVHTAHEDDEGWSREYSVVWRLRPEEKKMPKTESTDIFSGFWDPPTDRDNDIDFGSGRDVTLHITPKDLEVRVITGVSFGTEDHKVDHLVYTAPADPDF